MRRIGHRLFPFLAGAVALSALGWALSQEKMPPADFTFSNGTEVETLDPAVVTGQPEGRVIRGIFEGLCDLHPETLEPIPGMAESWQVSPDGKTYTFTIRKNAVWTDRTPVTAGDFVYSFRRFLDPSLGAQYSFLLYAVTGAEKYNLGKVAGGDLVEVELPQPVEGALPFARPLVLRGKAVEVTEVVVEEEKLPVYRVEIKGKQTIYCTSPAAISAKERDKHGWSSIEKCNQVLLDFSEVAIKAEDDHTLVLGLDYPVSYFLSLMGFYPLFPVQQKCVETHGSLQWVQPENIVSNGPFELTYRRVRDRIRMTKSDTYWDADNVKIETIDALAGDSITTDLNMYMTGQTDYVPAVPAVIIPELKDRADYLSEPYLSIYFYRINTTRPELKDPRVRLALSLALMRTEVVEKISRAGEIPAFRLVPPGIPAYDELREQHNDAELEEQLHYNVKKAQELMAAAGYPGGKKFPKIEILYNTNETHSSIAELIQSQWKESLGIDVELVNKEWGSYLDDQRRLKYDVCRAGWIGDYADPNTFLDLFLTGGAQNQTGWSHNWYDTLIANAALVELPQWEAALTKQDEADLEKQVRQLPGWTEAKHAELLKAARKEKQAEIREKLPKNRMECLYQAELILMEELPVIPIYYYVSKAMVKTYVKGFYPNIQDIHPLKTISIDQKEKARVLAEEGR